MSEKEKMLAALHYNSRDPELIERYYLVRKLLIKLNNSSPIDSEQRNELFTSLLGRIGDNVWIETPFFCDYGEHIYIDEGTFINVNAIFLDNNIINIGKNGLIGPGVQLLTASHPLSARERLITSNENLKTSYKTFSNISEYSLILPVPALPERRPSALFTFLNHLKVDSFKEGVKSNTLPLQTVRSVGGVTDSAR